MNQKRQKFKCNTVQKKKFSIKDFFRKCDPIRSFLQIWLHLLKKPLMKNFVKCKPQLAYYVNSQG